MSLLHPSACFGREYQVLGSGLGGKTQILVNSTAYSMYSSVSCSTVFVSKFYVGVALRP